MERLNRLLRLARLRGDRLAIATLETATHRHWFGSWNAKPASCVDCGHPMNVTEAELRALWGDR